MLFLGITVIISIPSASLQTGIITNKINFKSGWNNVAKGIQLLFGNSILRFALSMEFVAAIAGALVLVNTVALIKTTMQLKDSHYGQIQNP